MNATMAIVGLGAGIVVPLGYLAWMMAINVFGARAEKLEIS